MTTRVPLTDHDCHIQHRVYDRPMMRRADGTLPGRDRPWWIQHQDELRIAERLDDMMNTPAPIWASGFRYATAIRRNIEQSLAA